MLAASRSAPRQQPNVILILTDDQGYADLSCHGNPILRTPHLDRLHKESVRFTNFHSDPLCAPTRAALMTGRYALRAGVFATYRGRELLRRDESTMAGAFAAAGYRTGIFGKWHLGDNYPYRPEDRGFQESVVHRGGGIGQAPDYWGNSYFDDTYFRNGSAEKFRGYCTDVFFREALRFIEENRRRPFFVYLPTNAPHSPFRVPARYSRDYEKQGLPPQTALFYGMITNIDENAGRLLGGLRDLGLEQNTIVVFMTDNGTSAGYLAAGGGAKWTGYNAGMRGIKLSPYEGGHRVPLWIRWPLGNIGGGQDVNRLTAHLDVLPTLAELAGLRHQPRLPLDGRSLVPLIRRRGAWPDRVLVVQTHQQDEPRYLDNSAVMTERWRLINGAELYDVQADPGQQRDVAGAHRETMEWLRDVYREWYSDAAKHAGRPHCEIVLGSERENPTHLSCFDWHGDDAVPWDQSVIREDRRVNGFWAVEAARSGRYEFTLRQRPPEVRYPIDGTAARLAIDGTQAERPVAVGATEVRFTAYLRKGSTRLQTWFCGPAGPLRGAYFVSVKFQG